MKVYLAAFRALIALSVVLGIAYPLAITGFAQVASSHTANGSVIHTGGRVVGSSLIGQSFSDAKGHPLPQWFQPRPSAVDYDASTSGASNLGPESQDLIEAINQRRAAVAKFDSVPGHTVDPARVPADALTASASGLDPDISVDYAREQVYRVAAARHLDVSRVQALVDSHTEDPSLGVFGTTVVNVVELNAALAQLG